MAIEATRIEREFILKTIVDQNIAIDLVRGERRTRARLKSVSPKGLEFVLEKGESFGLNAEKMVDIYFHFKGTLMSARSRVLDEHENVIVVQLLQNLYRDLKRNYERIRPEEEVAVSILLDGTTLVLDFPKVLTEVQSEPPQINVSFDTAKISQLLKAFRERTKSVASETKIVMFRERQPTLIVEHLVGWSGKSVILPFRPNENLLRRNDDSLKDVLSEEEIRSLIKSSGRDPIVLSQEFKKHLDNLSTKKIWHELYVPILYTQYVIGYIYLIRADNQMAPFQSNVIEFVRQFTQILAYSLASNNYFNTTPTRESFNKSELVDISASGLMFSMPLNGPVVSVTDDLDIKLTLKERVIEVQARVMRKLEESGRIFFGLQFNDLSIDDHEFLMTTLYRNAPINAFSDESILGGA